MRCPTLLIVLVALACTTTSPPRPDKAVLDQQPKLTLRQAYDRVAKTDPTTAVRLLDKNVDAWATRWVLLAGARERIDTTYFILETDVFGRAFLGMLLKKAKQGVKVRLMVDGRGAAGPATPGAGLDLLQELVHTGNADVRIYNPITSKIVDTIAQFDFKPAAASNHDKMILVDQSRAIMGGRNLSKDYMASPEDHEKAFVDVDVLLEGRGAVQKLQEAFDAEFDGTRSSPVTRELFNVMDPTDELLLGAEAMEAWMSADKSVLDEAALKIEGLVLGPRKALPSDRDRAFLKSYAKELATHPALVGALDRVKEVEVKQAEVRILDSESSRGAYNAATDLAPNQINAQIVRMVEAAEREVIVQNPYVVLSDYGLEVLKRAGERGVKITMLTNSPVSSDSALTQALFLRAWPKLLAAVPNMRLFVLGDAHLLHSKVGVFDGEVTMLGSYNLDYLSAYVNSEVVASVWSKTFAAQNRDVIMSKVESGAPLVYEYTIKRDAGGAPILDDEGKPQIAFGPEDHCEQSVLDKISAIGRAIEAANIDDLEPLL